MLVSSQLIHTLLKIGTEYKLTMPPGTVKFITMTEEVALKAGVRKDHVKVYLEDGEKRYPAVVEVFHQLHCLVSRIPHGSVTPK